MTDRDQLTIGYVGLGIMGGPMALNLLRAGYRLIVNDVRREAAQAQLALGASWADTPAQLAASADVIFTCLPSLQIIAEVALGSGGLIEGIRSGSAFFEMSTNSRSLLEKLDAAFREKGAHVLDAPVSGGAGGAVRGQMGIWVGGDRAIFDRFEPVLRVMGDMPAHVGPIGSGLVTKLVHNCTSQATQAAIAEVFTMGVKAGADPLSLWAAIRQGSIGRRRTFDGLVDEFLPAAFDPPHAALRIIEKDLTLATQLGRDLRVPMRFANLALADVQEAMNRGWGDRDARSVMLLPQERAGVSIKVAPDQIEEVLRKDPPAPTDTKRGSGG
ncbi:NAD(P)-dependent oxidoreductase [Novosphingobium album (ex Liu et al. 2023)]|uniref:NAD(P)-dependent oxidoreductase n=1 Tax=Novosphingobium album (ex Liu et al. 2023) TaxID=3031130 RepID=A0ABT5WQV8_9SPHN|nr:NAD(P)-dependent oxidoreductase [Novosphingobium album (ex Liu et al. 2023)]MDE8652430.1 NAD(P)-dependent oxidoreductase [Novosphingobium album (ex Liu et al. 2023)]